MDQILNPGAVSGFQNAEIPLLQFVLNLLGSAGLALVLAWFFVKYGQTLSNRKLFARNFLPVATTTMLIISVVKSSLALSLGLVGALSIVRFRAAIKEPEELAYLFLTIAIGLGFGANQYLITLAAFVVILALLWARQGFRRKESDHNLVVSFKTSAPDKIDLGHVAAILKEHCRMVSLARVEESQKNTDALFLVELDALDQLLAAKNKLLALGDGVHISFVDRRSLP